MCHVASAVLVLWTFSVPDFSGTALVWALSHLELPASPGLAWQ